MPLSAALLAKLSKRGIIKEVNQEEVIAESYDTEETGVDSNLIVLGCKNRWNPYHKCTKLCRKLWGTGKEEDPEDKKRRLYMLKKYPLTEEWKEIFDPISGRFYYWNCVNDKVSWLVPNHPRAKLSISITQLFKEAIAKSEEQMKQIEEKRAKYKIIPTFTYDKDKDSNTDDDDDDDDIDEGESEKIPIKTIRTTPYIRKPNYKNANKKRRDDLDPMDPAAYSDIPRGTWSSGLHGDGEAVTGVDQTASGPLFQMRPYPSPGDILKRKEKAQKSTISKKKKQQKPRP